MHRSVLPNIGSLEFEIFHSDNADYGTEWNGLRLNDDYHRIYFIAGGEAQVCYNDTDLTLVEGHSYLFPTTTSFRYACPSRLWLLNICFKMTIQGGLDVLTLHPSTVEVPVADPAETLRMMAQIDTLVLKDTFSHQIALRGLILTLLSPHFRAQDTDRGRQRRRDMQRLAPVLRHIADRLRTGVRITDLPDIAGMSRSYFSRKFTETLGISAQDYVRRQRVEAVKRELRSSSLPLEALAEDLGYSSASHLSRDFKRHTGQTPASFRNLDRYYD